MRQRRPLYRQILEVLRQRIRSGRYAVGNQLPTEDSLVQTFDVSRHTVRAAVQQLVAEGVIERFPGRGSFVVRRLAPASHWSIESVEDLIGTSFADRYEVIAAKFIRARDDPPSAALYELGPKDSVFSVRALRSSADGPYAYSSIFLPPGIGEKLPRRLFGKRPFLLLVEEYCGLIAVRARQTATAVAATREAARRLAVCPGTPLLALERAYFTREGRPIELVQIQYRPDRFQHVANFWRRRDVPSAVASDHRDGRVTVPDAGGRRVLTPAAQA